MIDKMLAHSTLTAHENKALQRELHTLTKSGALSAADPLYAQFVSSVLPACIFARCCDATTLRGKHFVCPFESCSKNAPFSDTQTIVRHMREKHSGQIPAGVFGSTFGKSCAVCRTAPFKRREHYEAHLASTSHKALAALPTRQSSIDFFCLPFSRSKSVSALSEQQQHQQPHLDQQPPSSTSSPTRSPWSSQPSLVAKSPSSLYSPTARSSTFNRLRSSPSASQSSQSSMSSVSLSQLDQAFSLSPTSQRSSTPSSSLSSVCSSLSHTQVSASAYKVKRKRVRFADEIGDENQEELAPKRRAMSVGSGILKDDDLARIDPAKLIRVVQKVERKYLKLKQQGSITTD